MTSTVRARFWIETVLAAASAVLGVMTVFWRDWIELLTGLDPDRQSGGLEWGIAVALLGAAFAAAAVARAELRRAS
jgi:undecaprenyl pyrophosphate phosphatase UppP